MAAAIHFRLHFLNLGCSIQSFLEISERIKSGYFAALRRLLWVYCIHQDDNRNVQIPTYKQAFTPWGVICNLALNTERVHKSPSSSPVFEVAWGLRCCGSAVRSAIKFSRHMRTSSVVKQSIIPKTLTSSASVRLSAHVLVYGNTSTWWKQLWLRCQHRVQVIAHC